MKERINKNNGITLIALVITIIVMLILVAVTINMAVNGGLFGYAAKAVKDTGKAKNQEINLANLSANMTIDQLIQQFEPEKEWTIAWVYKNSHWSNPYFKNKTLENSFTFTGMDTNYSINSEDDLEGDFVAKLYTDGTLKISGTGAIPDMRFEDNVIPSEPWTGGYNRIYQYNGNITEGYGGDDSLNYGQYLSNTISSILIDEGITSIPIWAFCATKATSYEFPTTITNIDFEAFIDSEWIRAIDEATPGYPDWNLWYRCVDLDIYGNTYKLAVYQLD